MRGPTSADLDNWFTYHAPNEVQIAQYAILRQRGQDLADVILMNCPPCADTTAAIRKVREAVMTANASIACHGHGSEDPKTYPPVQDVPVMGLKRTQIGSDLANCRCVWKQGKRRTSGVEDPNGDAHGPELARRGFVVICGDAPGWGCAAPPCHADCKTPPPARRAG